MRQRNEAHDARLRLNHVLAASSIATWTWDIPADRVIADTNLARLFSVSPEDALGGPLASYVHAIHPDDIERVSRVIGDAVVGGSVFDEEYRVTQADGSIRWVVARGNVERDRQGRALRLSGAVVDVTERKRADVQLRESEERYRSLYNSIDAGFYAARMIYDDRGVPIDFRFLAVNPAFEKQTNWTNVLGKTVCEFAPDLESYWFETFDTIVRTGEPMRYEKYRRGVGSTLLRSLWISDRRPGRSDRRNPLQRHHPAKTGRGGAGTAGRATPRGRRPQG